MINGTPKILSPSGSQENAAAEQLGVDTDTARAKSPRGDLLRPHKSMDLFRPQSPDVLSLRPHKSHDEEIHLRRSDDVINTERPPASFLEQISKSKLESIIKEHTHSTYASVAGSMHSYMREPSQYSVTPSDSQRIVLNDSKSRTSGSLQVGSNETERKLSQVKSSETQRRSSQATKASDTERVSSNKLDQRSSQQSTAASKPEVKSSSIPIKASNGMEVTVMEEAEADNDDDN